MNPSIYKCSFGFRYTKYFVSIILIADDFDDAKTKIIAKCLEKYDSINSIDFEMFYDSKESDTLLPIKFENILVFENYLYNNINEDNIECLSNISFEIIDEYDN